MTLHELAKQWKAVLEARGPLACLETARGDILALGPEGEQRCIGALRLLHQALLSRSQGSDLLALIASAVGESLADAPIETDQIQVLRIEVTKLRADLARREDEMRDLGPLVNEVYALRANRSRLEREVTELEGALQ